MIGLMTLKEIRDLVAAQIGDTSSGRATKIDLAINMHYCDFASRKRWPQLVRSSEELVTVSSGSKFVYLPKDVEQVYFILPQNSDALLQATNIEQLFNVAGDTFDTPGAALSYAEAGDFARRYDFLAAGEQLSVAQTGLTSTSSAYVTGIVGGSPGAPTSTERGETVTVSATAGVYTNLTAGETYYDISTFSVQANTSAYYTLKGVTSGTIYAQIAPGDQTVRYRRLRLMNPPDADTAVTVYWKKRVAKLVNDNQSIELPIGYAIVNKTMATMYANQREYNAAMGYHDSQGESLADRAFDGAMTQGEKIEQGVPMIGSLGRRHVIIRN